MKNSILKGIRKVCKLIICQRVHYFLIKKASKEEAFLNNFIDSLNQTVHSSFALRKLSRGLPEVGINS